MPLQGLRAQSVPALPMARRSSFLSCLIRGNNFQRQTLAPGFPGHLVLALMHQEKNEQGPEQGHSPSCLHVALAQLAGCQRSCCQVHGCGGWRRGEEVLGRDLPHRRGAVPLVCSPGPHGELWGPSVLSREALPGPSPGLLHSARSRGTPGRFSL